QCLVKPPIRFADHRLCVGDVRKCSHPDHNALSVRKTGENERDQQSQKSPRSSHSSSGSREPPWAQLQFLFVSARVCSLVSWLRPQCRPDWCYLEFVRPRPAPAETPCKEPDGVHHGRFARAGTRRRREEPEDRQSVE